MPPLHVAARADAVVGVVADDRRVAWGWVPRQHHAELTRGRDQPARRSGVADASPDGGPCRPGP